MMPVRWCRPAETCARRDRWSPTSRRRHGPCPHTGSARSRWDRGCRCSRSKRPAWCQRRRCCRPTMTAAVALVLLANSSQAICDVALGDAAQVEFCLGVGKPNRRGFLVHFHPMPVDVLEVRCDGRVIGTDAPFKVHGVETAPMVRSNSPSAWAQYSSARAMSCAVSGSTAVAAPWAALMRATSLDGL